MNFQIVNKVLSQFLNVLIGYLSQNIRNKALNVRNRGMTNLRVKDNMHISCAIPIMIQFYRNWEF